MAKDKNQVKGEGDGWIDVTSERAPWIVKEPGLAIEGELLGRYEFKNEDRAYYQVKLSRGSCQAMRGRGETKEEITVKEGEVVNIDETAALADLAAVAKSNKRHMVRIHFLEKVQLDGGNSFWEIKVQRKEIGPKEAGAADVNSKQSALPF